MSPTHFTATSFSLS